MRLFLAALLFLTACSIISPQPGHAHDTRNDGKYNYNRWDTRTDHAYEKKRRRHWNHHREKTIPQPSSTITSSPSDHNSTQLPSDSAEPSFDNLQPAAGGPADNAQTPSGNLQPPPSGNAPPPAGTTTTQEVPASLKRWAVYYDNTLPPERFLPYDVIVFDSASYPRLRPLQNRGKTLLGYVSFGEAEEYRNYFPDIKAKGLLLTENPNWPGHFVVDARNPEWAKYLVEVLIPDILHNGFNGIMIDTIDSLVWLEDEYPDKYPGMRQAAINLIRTVRLHYPDMPIMLNRGIEILPQVEQDITMLMAESIYVKHDFKTGKNALFPESEYREALNAIKAAQSRAPHLEVYALEYWDPADKKGVKAIYDELRANGFSPFVSVIGLDELHEAQ